MNCERFEDIVSDLARERMMEANAREEGLAHSAECESCAAKLRDERALTVSLRALAVEVKSIAAPPVIEERLLLAFQSQTVASQRQLAAHYWRYWAGAAAAILLIAFATAAIGWRLSGAPESKPVENAKGPAQKPAPQVPETAKPDQGPPPAPEVAQGPDGPPSLTSPAVRRFNRNPRNIDAATVAATNGSQNTEIATDFMPVGYGNAAGLQDGGQVVRVQLPRSVLATFGLPVNMARTNERVKADVLVGTDGLAHAIRFVQ
jgi:hypothetical protein